MHYAGAGRPRFNAPAPGAFPYSRGSSFDGYTPGKLGTENNSLFWKQK